eukprot:403362495
MVYFSSTDSTYIFVGKTDGQTYLKAVTVDNQSNIYVGGSTEDNFVIPFLTSTYHGIIQKIDVNGVIQWKKYALMSGYLSQTYFEGVTQMSLNNAQDKLIVTFDKSFYVLVVNANNGTQYAVYKIGLFDGIISPQGIAIDFQDNIYVGARSDTFPGYEWMLFGFPLQPSSVSSISTIFNFRLSNFDDLVFGLVLNKAKDILYVSGETAAGVQSFPSIIGVDIKIQPGKINFIHLNNNVSSLYNHQGTYLDVYTENYVDYIFNVITETFDTEYLKITYAQRVKVSSLSIIDFTQLILLPTSYNIIKVQAISSSKAYLIGDDEVTDDICIFEIDFEYSGTKANLRQIRYPGYNSLYTFYYSAIVVIENSVEVMYFVGTTKGYFISSANSILGNPGILSSTSPDNLCFQPNPVSEIYSEKQLTKYWSYFTTTRTIQSASTNYVVQASLTDWYFGNLGLPQTNFCPYYKGLTTYPDSTTYFCYTSDGSQNITTLQPFVFQDTRCTDYKITYTMTSTDMSLPTIFSYDAVTNKINCNPTATTTQQIYTVTITGTVSITTPGSTYGAFNSSSASTTFKISVKKKDCNYATLTVTSPNISTITYYYGAQKINVALDQFGISDPNCAVTITLHENTGASLASQAVSYNQTTNVISVGYLGSGAITARAFYFGVTVGTYSNQSSMFDINFNTSPGSCTSIVPLPMSSPQNYSLGYGDFRVELNCLATPTNCQETLTFKYKFQGLTATSFENLINSMNVNPFRIVKSSSSLYYYLFINTNDIAVLQTNNPNVVSLQILAQDISGSQFNCTNTFDLSFDDDLCSSVVISPSQFQQTVTNYTIGDPKLKLTFNDWTYSPNNNCGSFIYSIVYSANPNETVVTQLYAVLKEVHIESVNLDIPSFSYDIKIVGTLSNTKSDEYKYSGFQIINPCDGLDLIQMDTVTDIYYVNSSATTFMIPYNSYNQETPPSICIQKFFRSKAISQINAFPAGVTYTLTAEVDGYELTVESDNNEDAGNYTFEIATQYSLTTEIFNYILQIKVRNICLGIIPQKIEDKYYNLSKTLVTYQEQKWLVNPSVTPSICDSIQYFPFYEGTINIPSFIFFDSSLLTIQIQSLVPSDEGTHSFQILGQSGGIGQNISFNVHINNPCKDAKIIKSSLPDQNYKIGKESVVKFTKWKSTISGCDDFEYSATMSGIEDIDSVISFKQDERSFKISTTDQTYQNQKINIKITGIAYYGQDTLDFVINMQGEKSKEAEESDTEIKIGDYVIDKSKLTKKLTAKISEVSQYGEATLYFSQPLLITNNQLRLDTLDVQFLLPKNFISKNMDAIIQNGYEISRDVPPQITNSTFTSKCFCGSMLNTL